MPNSAAPAGLNVLQDLLQNADAAPAIIQRLVPDAQVAADITSALARLRPMIAPVIQTYAPGSDDDGDNDPLGESARRARESSHVPAGMVFSFDDDESTRVVRESSLPRGMTFTFET